MPLITFQPANITVESREGASLLDAARSAGVFVETPCGGKGTCQKCKVEITENGEQGTESKEQSVLICQTKVPNYSITVELSKSTDVKGQFENFEDPEKYLNETKEQFLKKINLSVAPPALLDGLSDADRFTKAFLKTVSCQSLELPLNILKTLPEKLRENNGKLTAYYYLTNNTANLTLLTPHSSLSYGLAVDIGTTTVALWLVDLESRKILASRSAYNGQIECGLDVISRINYASSSDASRAKRNLDELRSRILKTINELVTCVCDDAKIESDKILCASLAGNTTMIHLLLGINPEYIRLSPYTPAIFQPQVYTAAQIGISVCESAPVLIAPAVGSYVGGDITAGLLCTSLALNEEKNADETILFIDIGTNGEIVLGNREFVFACACSAGPAFEGGGIKHGVRAQTGAIERVTINNEGKPEIFTIGGAPAAGICGSGIISAVAQLFENGIIDSAGKFAKKNGEYTLCDNIAINETDIDNFIRAKGAIFSACQTLLDSVGMTFNDVEKIYVAGGFGRFLDLDNARTVGLLPRLSGGKYIFLGNSSVIGAYLTLVSEEHRRKACELTGRITYVDLSSESGYMDRYTGALFLPHTDKRLFEQC